MNAATKTLGSERRFEYSTLHKFATELSVKIGMPRDRAEKQSEILLEADLMGHTTHGLAQLSGMLRAIESGKMRLTGEPTVISDHGASVFLDADRLPGTWLLSQVISEACSRAEKYGTATYVIKQITNIACLGAYLRQATDRGFTIMILNSDPSMRTVVPSGGIDGQISPNPLAFGYPTDGDPILIDISTASTANGWVRRWSAEGKKLPGPWLQNAQGEVSDDPSVLFANPPGAMLPLGGLELGYKGFALGLIVEALTAGLGGTGRSADIPAGTGTPVFVQVCSPQSFAGATKFIEETSFLASSCRSSRPLPGGNGVRMPGDSAIRKRREQMEAGIWLYPSIMPELETWANKLGVTLI